MAIPQQTLSKLDAVAVVMGIVIGTGIFLLPPLVASNVDGPATFIAVWIAGGIVSLFGALCYSELAATYPNTGGDYHFIMRAYGAGPGFLFAWARMTVIQPGTIALPAFAIGDYLSAAIFDPVQSPTAAHLVSTLSAAAVVIVLTAINMAGVREGKSTQKFLASLTIVGIVLIIVSSMFATPSDAAAATPAAPADWNTLGTAMVLVLFTYGGWSEASYLSAEMTGGRRNIVWALVLGISAVTVIYLLVNLAYLAALGFDGMRQTQAIAADALRAAWGTTGALLITAILIASALSTANATMFTGARSNYALGRDFRAFRFLGQWSDDTSTPRNAFLVQGLIALALVGLGALTRHGIKTMVDYTSPVFWFFFLLVGIGLFVLRFKDPAAERPFRVPFYPVLPAIFCLAAGYLLYSSLAYYQWGAMVGVAVLLTGMFVMLFGFARRAGSDPGGPDDAPADGAKVASLADLPGTVDD